MVILPFLYFVAAFVFVGTANAQVPEEVATELTTTSEYVETDGYTRWVRSEGGVVEQFFSQKLEKRYFPDGRIEAFDDDGKRVFEKKVNGTEIFYNKDGDVASIVTEKTLSQFNKGVLVSQEYRSLLDDQNVSFRDGHAVIRKGSKDIKVFVDKESGAVTVETPILFGYTEMRVYVDNQTKSLVLKNKDGIEKYVLKDGEVAKSSLKVSFVRFFSKIFSRKASQDELNALVDLEILQYID